MEKHHSIVKNMRRFAGIVEYDGTSFKGFQRQPNRFTVQGEIERCLENMIGSFVQITAAGRTDAGVHSRGQVIAFSIDVCYQTEVIKRALNARLPKDIRIISLVDIVDQFDPRRDAITRSYRYVVSTGSSESVFDNRFSHYIGASLNSKKMEKGMQLFIGEHDFCNFAGSGVQITTNTIRNVKEAYIEDFGDKVELYFEANAFMRHQVRNMAGLILRVGLSRSSLSDVSRFLESNLGTIRPPMLPAKGLFMEKVTYPDSVFIDTKLIQGQDFLVSLRA
jgi:tRNA pseudouridine38-40 synthase